MVCSPADLLDLSFNIVHSLFTRVWHSNSPFNSRTVVALTPCCFREPLYIFIYAFSGHLLFPDSIGVYGLHMFHVFLNLTLIKNYLAVAIPTRMIDAKTARLSQKHSVRRSVSSCRGVPHDAADLVIN